MMSGQEGTTTKKKEEGGTDAAAAAAPTAHDDGAEPDGKRGRVLARLVVTEAGDGGIIGVGVAYYRPAVVVSKEAGGEKMNNVGDGGDEVGGEAGLSEKDEGKPAAAAAAAALNTTAAAAAAAAEMRITCPVCRGKIRRGPILQCSNGHLLCAPCTSKVRRRA